MKVVLQKIPKDIKTEILSKLAYFPSADLKKALTGFGDPGPIILQVQPSHPNLSTYDIFWFASMQTALASARSIILRVCASAVPRMYVRAFACLFVCTECCGRDSFTFFYLGSFE